MVRHSFILLLVLIISCNNALFAQPLSRYNTFSYNVNEGLLQSTMGDIEVDKNNFYWIVFPNGIQKFDGKNFINVPVQPGLPDDKHCYFFKCSNGDLLIGHSEGISRYIIEADRFVQVYKNKEGKKGAPVFIGEDEGLIYFFVLSAKILAIDALNYTLVKETQFAFSEYKLTIGDRPTVSKNIINHKTAFRIKNTLYLWDLKNEKLLYQSAQNPFLQQHLLKLKTEYELYSYNYKTNNALQLYNFANGITSSIIIKGKDDKQIGRCNIHPWKNKILISLANRLYEVDTGLHELKTELVNFKNEPIAGSANINTIKEDNFGNLFLTTVNGGVRKIIGNNYPVKYYGTNKKEDNFILSLLPDKKNNRILAGSTNGLLVFDTLQNLVKHITKLPGQPNSFSPITIIKSTAENYLLFNWGSKNIWLLNKDLSIRGNIPLTTKITPDKSGIAYFANPLFQNKTGAITQSEKHLYKTTFAGPTVYEHQFTTAYTMSGIFYNGKIITHANNELIYLDTANFEIIKKIPFLNTGNVRCFTKAADNSIYMGSNKGIFIIDSSGKILRHLTKQTGLPDDCIYAMVFDNDGALWCSTNKGILKISKDNSILQLKKEDGLQENEFNTNEVARAEDGEIFFAGVNGISSFYPAAIGSFDEKINLLFTRIKSNNEDVIKDTAVWNISRIILPYNKNALSFDFLAMGNSNSDQYIYQYRMDGVDKEWIQNSDLQTVRYSLPPGRYTFKIYASRSFNKDAKPVKEIRIIIRPPFWKSWWFISLAAIMFICLLAYFINQKNKKKYAEKLRELENQRELKEERERISRDLHDSLGAYANAVLYNTELLEKENTDEKRKELIGDLKFASKDIITSLRETVWALKKEKYTAEETFVRIRNFIQPLSRYYSHIHFRIDGEAPAEMELPYNKALNLVRIVQEAVSNSIKHANAGEIIVSSKSEEKNWYISITDNGKGFDYAAARKAEDGNGLNNMQQRAAVSGFNFTTDSIQNKGTTISIVL